MGESDSAHSTWKSNKKEDFRFSLILNIDILLCFQAIMYFLLYVFPDVYLDLHIRSSYIVIGASFIQRLMDYNSPYNSFCSPKES